MLDKFKVSDDITKTVYRQGQDNLIVYLCRKIKEMDKRIDKLEKEVKELIQYQKDRIDDRR